MKKEHKQFVEDRAQACCEYCLCQAAFSPDPFVVEHIIPISRDGKDELSNLALSC
jgi:5-methylcytosine-specific restriction endonuclease McrA